MPPAFKQLKVCTRTAQTGYAKLVTSWQDCQLCPLHVRRSRVVHLRGTVPCKALFIGEAPGRTEDLNGFPFTGDAGRDVLDPILAQVWANIGKEVPYAITNIVACMPEEDRGRWETWGDEGQEEKHWAADWQLREPTPQEALTCQPRLMETVFLCRPSKIVVMGKIAARDFRKVHKEWFSHVPVLGVWHPAYIIYETSRAGIMEANTYQFKTMVSRLANFLRDLA
jgi:uracil-DNA glycosylase